MTDQEPTQEELQEFWEKFDLDVTHEYIQTKGVIFTVCAKCNGNIEYNRKFKPLCRVPGFTLDNLFKYAVPKLRENHWWVCLDQVIGRDYWRCQIVYANCAVAVTREHDKPELALFRAIQEAIK